MARVLVQVKGLSDQLEMRRKLLCGQSLGSLGSLGETSCKGPLPWVANDSYLHKKSSYQTRKCRWNVV